MLLQNIGTTNIYAFSNSLISPDRMINEKLEDQVEEEYEKIAERRENVRSFDKDSLRKQFLEEVLSQQVLNNHEKGEKYVVPKLDDLTQEELDYFLNKLQILDGNVGQLGEEDINSIVSQINGEDIAVVEDMDQKKGELINDLVGKLNSLSFSDLKKLSEYCTPGDFAILAGTKAKRKYMKNDQYTKDGEDRTLSSEGREIEF